MQIIKFTLGLTQILAFFRYQHVGIGNAKLWHWACKPMPVPNAKGFALQWNIGFSFSIVEGRYELENIVSGVHHW